MKFEKSVLTAAFGSYSFSVPPARNPNGDTVELAIISDSGSLNTDKELPLMIEPLRYAMQERFGEKVAVLGGVTSGMSVIQNSGGNACVSIKLGTSHAQELMNMIGDMYKNLNYVFIGVTDKGEVLMPANGPDMTGEFKMPDSVRGVLKMTADAYGKQPGSFTRF